MDAHGGGLGEVGRTTSDTRRVDGGFLGLHFVTESDGTLEVLQTLAEAVRALRLGMETTLAGFAPIHREMAELRELIGDRRVNVELEDIREGMAALDMRIGALGRALDYLGTP